MPMAVSQQLLGDGAEKGAAVDEVRADMESARVKYRLDLLFMRRFMRLLHIFVPHWRSHGALVVVLLVGVASTNTYLSSFFGKVNGRFYKGLVDADAALFWHAVWRAFFFFAGVTLLAAMSKLLTQYMSLSWREALCIHLHALYFGERGEGFYKVNSMHHFLVDNPDQRVTEDIENFCENTTEMMQKGVVAVFSVAYYTYYVHALVDWQGVVGLYAFFALATAVNHFILQPIVALVWMQDKLEGNLRFAHLRVRTHAESVALQRGRKHEMTYINRCLREVIGNLRRLMLRNCLLTSSYTFFEHLGSMANYFIVAFAVFYLHRGHDDPGERAQYVNESGFAAISLIFGFSEFIKLAEYGSQVAGNTARVSELLESLELIHDITPSDAPDTLKSDGPHGSTDTHGGKGHGGDRGGGDESGIVLLESIHAMEHGCAVPHSPTPTPQDRIAVVAGADLVFDGVDCCTPGSTVPLIRGLRMRVAQHQHTLIMGGSGTGKSSLMRVCAGLWPLERGSITRPRDLLFLPQKPYTIVGSLFQQVIYPLEHADAGDGTAAERVRDALDMVGLSNLLTRVDDDLFREHDWHMHLSPGEEQRLAMARVLFHRPRFAFLDESTSAVDADTEVAMYQHCHRLGVTTVSIGHRTSLLQFHAQLLTVLGGGHWRVSLLVDGGEGAAVDHSEQ